MRAAHFKKRNESLDHTAKYCIYMYEQTETWNDDAWFYGENHLQTFYFRHLTWKSAAYFTAAAMSVLMLTKKLLFNQQMCVEKLTCSLVEKREESDYNLKINIVKM